MHSVNSTVSENYTPNNNSFLPWLVCISAAMFFFYEFIQMNMFNAINADLMHDFDINATQVGTLSAIYFYANLLFLPFAGMLLDRFSTRRIIIITLFICAVGIGCFSFTTSVYWAGLFRFMSGIGSAFCFLSSIRLASRWFTPNRMALVSGLIVTMAMTGGMVAQTPLTFLIEYLGWRRALLLDSVLGFLIIALVFAVVRDYPSDAQSEKISRQQSLQDLGLFASWRLAYFNLQNWLAGIYTCMLNLPSALLGAIWGNLYLVQVEHLSRLEASYVTTFLFVGTIIGGPVVGLISDRIQRRCFPMRLGALFSIAVILAIIYLHGLPLTVYMGLFFLLGFVTSTQVISYPLIAESNSRMLTATSVSVVSFCAISGYAIFQPLFGWIMDYSWGGTIINNVRIYSVNDYYHALWIMPIGFIIALFATFFLRETYCKAKD